METQLPQGLVKISDYKSLLQSELFSRMENFSNNFIDQTKEILSPYSRKWVTDPLHQWSRQWEYPFVFTQIEKYTEAHKGKPIKILDAGSGITFFPYFINEMAEKTALMCCDTDPTLKQVVTSVNECTGNNVEFLHKDMRCTGLEDNSFDVIYCISALEHTKNFDEIIKEFGRLLKNEGILIVTLDISLDGRSDIPVNDMKILIASLQNHLPPTDRDSIRRLLDEKNLTGPEIITTTFIADWNKSLLPWKYPLVSSLLASLKKRKLPRLGIKNLTFTCHTFGRL